MRLALLLSGRSLVAATLGLSPVLTASASSALPWLGNEPTPESPISAEKRSDSAALSACAMLAFCLSYRGGADDPTAPSAPRSRRMAILVHNNGGVLLWPPLLLVVVLFLAF